MPLLSLHTANGGEFLNQSLIPWCRGERIGFTRGRPYRKNDQAYVEQRNGAVLRRYIGYDRYSTRPAFAALKAVHELLRLYVNFSQPVRKLISKERHGARVVKRYDRAQTARPPTVGQRRPHPGAERRPRRPVSAAQSPPVARGSANPPRRTLETRRRQEGRHMSLVRGDGDASARGGRGQGKDQGIKDGCWVTTIMRHHPLLR